MSQIIISPVEEETYKKALVLQRFKDKKQLSDWCKAYLQVDLADCKVSRFATSTPLDMVWDIYQFCQNATDDDEPLSIFYIAGRGSQKTLSCAVLQVLLPLHFGRALVHFGGTEDQAGRAYIYFKEFITKPYIREYLADVPKMTKTDLKVSGETVGIEILPLTEASVQGPHTPVVSIDELASLAPNKLAAYPSISGIPVYTKDGKPWVKFGISSRKGKYSIIETEYEDRHKTGAVFKFWTLLENTKRCPDSMSGTKDLVMYVNIYDNLAYTEDDFEKKVEPEKKNKFDRVVAKENCITCPLAAICAGDLKKQTSTCKSLKPVKASISDFKLSPYEWFLSQRMSLQPSSDDLVYTRFTRDAFEKTPNEIYEIFFGRPANAVITEEQLIELMIGSGVKRYAGLDHGYTHPASVVVVYEDAQQNAYIMNVFSESALEPADLVAKVAELKEKYKFNDLYPDTAAPAINTMLEKVCNVHTDFTKNVQKGIDLIKYKIYPPGAKATKLIGLKGNVDPLISDLEKYRFKRMPNGKLSDSPVKENDDSHDALSYAAQNRWEMVGSGAYITSEESSSDRIQFDPKTYAEKVQKLNESILKTEAQSGGSVNNSYESKTGGFYYTD